MRAGRLLAAAALIAGAWALAVALADRGAEPPPTPGHAGAPPPPATLTQTPANGPLRVSLVVRAATRSLLRPRLADPPRAGLVFDVASGEVLWQRRPHRRLPIASLTKMMTALLVAERHRPRELVAITRRAVAADGSKVGILPLGRRLSVDALMHGLMLVSGNDAAVALAQHDAGTEAAFVRRMNAHRRELGLRCSRFSSASGIRDEGNHACVLDLATLARAALANRWVARVVSRRRARFPLPGRGGVLDLFNINHFVAAGLPGVTGVKTGLTAAAGRCYVVTMRRGGRHLGVVLLDSPDPLRQVPRLLRAGFRAVGVATRLGRQPRRARMEPAGIEPATSGLQSRRSSS